MGVEAHVAAGFRGKRHLLGRPLLARLGIASHLLGGEGIEGLVVDGVHRHELALQMRGKLGDLDPVLLGGPD